MPQYHDSPARAVSYCDISARRQCTGFFSRLRTPLTAFALLPAACLLSACLGGKAHPGYQIVTGGSPDRGRAVIEHYECGKCHTIPGIQGAHGVFGPPLNFMGMRTMVAGNFPNKPETLVRWIKGPDEMKPKTAMPDLGLTEQQAQDAAAYLETLR